MAKRRRRYKTDPLTGIKYEKDSLMDMMGEMEKDLWRKPKKTYTAYPDYSRKSKRQNYYREPEVSFSDLPPWAQALIGIGILGVLAWIFVVKPFIDWAKQNIITIIIVSVIIVAVLITGFVFYLKHKRRKKEEKESFEKEQIEKGLIKFVDRFGNERWGKPDEIKVWTKEDEEAKEKEKLINQVISEIENFRPSRKYHNEFPYQVELVGYLKHKFPNADIEQQKGSSRPDIVVGDVAIEVKGPTKTQDLQTIADKCMRYYQHFGELVIVLFEVDVYEQRYDEWKKGINNTFPNVRIIRK